MIVAKFTMAGFGQTVTDLIANAAGRTPVQVLKIEGSQATISRDAAQVILAARAAEAAAKAEKERAEKALKDALGDATEVLVDGQVVFTYAPQEKTVLDTARLKEEQPDVYAAFGKQQVTRPLLVKSKVAASLFV